MKKLFNRLPDFLFFLSILFFTIGLNFQDNPPSGWYQQFLPDIGGRQISDVFFLDSLTGWAVTPYVTQNDTAYVLKTTNGGDNWIISNVRAGQYVGHNRIYFLDSLTGFVCGVSQFSGYKGLSKSTDGGFSWISLNVPDPFMIYDDMSVLNKDTIWLAASSSLTGGVFRTTNGGLNWTQQLSLGSMNPTNIYFYNRNIGFITKNNDYLRKTTDSGISWFLISGIDGFRDIYFADNLTGWKASSFGMKKTTDGGFNWVTQTMPSGGIISVSFIYKFSNINRDTIWGTGGYALYPNNQIRGLLYRTTNGGENWFYQIPDTSIHISSYSFIDFVDKYTGWVYKNSPTGIHTKSGGDTTFYSGLIKTGEEIPESFSLHQNYPNPFNSKTIISYDIKKSSNVRLDVYDIQGREMMTLVKQEQEAGT